MLQKFQNGCHEGTGEGQTSHPDSGNPGKGSWGELRIKSWLEEKRWKECFRKREWHVQRPGEERMVPLSTPEPLVWKRDSG